MLRPKSSLAIVASERPVKRRAADPLDDDPIARAKARYVSTRITLRALAAEFRGIKGCSESRLMHRAADEDWAELREQHYDNVAAETSARLGSDEAERNQRHMQSSKNVLVTMDGILQGIHREVTRVLKMQEENQLTPHGAVLLLKGLATAARNVAIGQTGTILLEQQLATTEGSGFQRFSNAAESKWQEVVQRREELVKRAEDAAREAENAAKRAEAKQRRKTDAG